MLASIVAELSKRLQYGGSSLHSTVLAGLQPVQDLVELQRGSVGSVAVVVHICHVTILNLGRMRFFTVSTRGQCIRIPVSNVTYLIEPLSYTSRDV